MPRKPKQPAAAKPRQPRFAPVPTRPRHDGWTPARQTAFIEALAASACVDEACASVGMTTSSAYRLRARFDAQSFRLAWDAAIDFGIRRLSDAVLSRALHGTPVPHYYRGEQIGEHRRYDNRLAQFLLRYRDPLRYAATLDQMVYTGHPEIAAVRLARHAAQVGDGHEGFDPAVVAGSPWRSEVASIAADGQIADAREAEKLREREREAAEEARRAEAAAELDALAREVRAMSVARDALPTRIERPPPEPAAGEGGPRVTWR